MKKLLVILGKELLLGLTDPITLLFAVAMPLVVTALIELAFGNLVLGRGVPDAVIPAAIVNKDQGGQWGNLGEMLSGIVISGTQVSGISDDIPFELFQVRQMEDEAQARRMVEREELVAALVIPSDFSETLSVERATLDLYINDRYILRGQAFQNLVHTLANMISTGEITARTTAQGLMAYPRARAELQAGQHDEAMTELVRVAVMPASTPIRVQLVSGVEQRHRLELAHYLAAAFAVFFTGFTGLIASASLLQERAQWTLQRMLCTPTRTGIILAGKALGTYLKGLIQIGVLLGSMTFVEGIKGGSRMPQPAIDPLGLFLLILALAAAATGFGVAISGLARTYAQAGSYGRGILVLMGLTGGIFFPVELFPGALQAISRATYHFWAMDGYLKLATGGNVITIMPHLLVLGAMASLFFALGGWRMWRREAFS